MKQPRQQNDAPLEPLAPGAAAWTRNDWIGAAFLVLAVFAAYQPVWHAGFIWDDDAHVIRPDLRSLHGLWRIWTDPSATQQFYPVLYSGFWVEHQLWGDAPSPYHLANLGLHCAAALLLFRLIGRLALPGALLGAALFALHPVNVETVAWISEQKNTLSAVFYFAAALAYLRFDRLRGKRWYALTVLLFTLAILSKSVTATLPASLLVVTWWRRGRFSVKQDIVPLAPLVFMGAAMGGVTAFFERTHVGASGAAFHLDAPSRVIIAGRALWFYLGKITWPAGLTFIYPRWDIQAASLHQWIFPACALAAVAGLWSVRGKTRGPLAVALLFAGTLFPALGFVNLFPFLYSFVADHFQYIAMVPVVAAAGAVIARTCGDYRILARTLSVGVLVVLGVFSWRQCREYLNAETLWRATIARNPGCWMAFNNLAVEDLKEGRVDEAAAHVTEGLRLNPDNAAAHATLGEAMGREGHPLQALEEYNKALQLEPYNAAAHIDLGDTLLSLGRVDEAVVHFNAALAVVPESAKAAGGLGEAYLRRGDADTAIEEFGRSLASDPSDASAHANLGTALMIKGRTDQATVQYEIAVGLDPHFLVAQYNLGNALIQSGNFRAAASHLGAALAIDPGFGPAQTSLGYALLKDGKQDEGLSHLRRALEIDPTDARAKGYLSDAKAR